MKVKILQYCQEKIEGRLIILDANRIIEINDNDALRLIDNGLARDILSEQECENKMLEINYKKRGRPRKEV